MAALLRPRFRKSIYIYISLSLFRAVGVKKTNASYVDSAADFARVAKGCGLTEQNLTVLRARRWRPHAGLVLATALAAENEQEHFATQVLQPILGAESGPSFGGSGMSHRRYGQREAQDRAGRQVCRTFGRGTQGKIEACQGRT